MLGSKISKNYPPIWHNWKTKEKTISINWSHVCINGLFIFFKLSDLTGTFRASNVSHTVVLRPLKAGYFNFTSASVSYLAQEGGQVVVKPVYYLHISKQCKCLVKEAEVSVLSAGWLHQCPRPGRHSGSEGVRPALLPTLCKCYIQQVFFACSIRLLTEWTDLHWSKK